MCILKLLAVGDLHVNPKNLHEVKLFTIEITKIILEEEPDILVFLGDQLNTMAKIDMDSLFVLTKCLQECVSISKNVVILVGNHCRHDNNDFLTERHGYTAFKAWDKTTIVDNVVTKEFMGKDGNMYKFLFVCYVPNGRFMEALELHNLKIPLEEYTAGCAHHEFTGTDINLLTKSKTDTWPENAPLLISGHLHSYQNLGNLMYPGVPFQHSFNDSLLRTVSIFEFSNNVNGVLKTWVERRIELNIPKKFTIVLTPEELINYELPDNNSYIKLKVKGEGNVIKEARKLQHVKDLEKTGKITIIEIPNPKINNEMKISKVKTRLSLEKRILKMVKKNGEDVIDIFNELFNCNV